MRTRDFVILGYSAFGGAMPGKTTLQKRIYFLAVMLDQVQELRYRAHYYGPYSDDVAEANSELKSLGYLRESSRSWGGSVNGFERVRYDYELTEDGNRLAQRKQREHSPMWEKIVEAAHTLEPATQLDYRELSIAAKAYFLLYRSGGRATSAAIQEKANKFGWNIEAGQLDRAVEFLETTGLVERV